MTTADAEFEFEIIKAYISSAKTFTQFSTGGLVLPVVLKSDLSKVFARSGSFSKPVLVLVCLSWAFFLTTIGAGVLYEYAAVKSLEHRLRSLTALALHTASWSWRSTWAR
jgi:hypothetical protein